MHRFLLLLLGISLLLTLVLAPRFAAADQGEAPDACVRLVGESASAFAVTLQPGCDLRHAASLFPQMDPTTRRPLPMQEQLRSIYAFNEARRASAPSAARTVARGCVPAATVPSSASPEELEICPRGVVNYFGVASLGNIALIYVPRTRTSTHTENLQDLARSACAALATVANPKSVSSLPAGAAQTLSLCRQFAGDVPVDALPAATPSQDPPAGPVKDLTVELQEKQKRIDALESAAALRWQGRSTEDRGPWALVFLTFIGMVGGVFGWLRLRKASRNKPPVAARPPMQRDGQVVVDKETLARAMSDIDRFFKLKLERESVRYQKQIDRQSAAIDDLQRQLSEGRDAQPTEARTPSAALRASREREKQLQEELAQERVAHAQSLQSHEEQIVRLQRERQDIDRQVQILKGDVLRQHKKVVSLGTRLKGAREKFRAVPPTPPRRSQAGAGGLPAAIAAGRVDAAMGC